MFHLLTNSLNYFFKENCVEISLEKLYVDFEAKRVKEYMMHMLFTKLEAKFFVFPPVNLRALVVS